MSTKSRTLSWESAPRALILNVLVFGLIAVFILNLANGPARAAGGTLSVTIIAAPNLVVDSNALATSTYAPKVATVIGKFCNTSSTNTVDNVTAYIGEYTGAGLIKGTPGTYPSKTNPVFGGLTYKGTYQFTHLGGAADAARYMGTLNPGECRYQYWSFEYPHYALDTSDNLMPTWGKSVAPGDDLSLDFHMWVIGDGGAALANGTHTATMRNEISAMANKIKPNGNPAGQWFNTDTSTVYPGQTVTTNGVYYRLGNVNQGFDNDGDGVPDYNAWLQPFGDPAYDPSCFRLVSVTGLLTVTRSAGNPDMVIPIYNNLYFTNLPPDNTDVRGLVYYRFLALGGACTVPISPYQEVASGSDNEKFNGDYGTGVPALMSYEPEVDISKNGPSLQGENTTFTYAIPFVNNSTTAQAGLTLSSSGVNAGLMISDSVPVGLYYVADSATNNNTIPSGNSVSVRFSTNGGLTWSSTDPGTVQSTSAARVVIQWWLNEPLAVSGSGNNSGTVRYQATIPSNYISSGYSPFIENCANASFGDAAPFDRACATTLVQGTASIGDRVWQDENRDGSQTGESGISGIKVSLYYDKNGDGKLDGGDVLVSEQDTSGTGVSNYDFTQLPAGKYIVKVDTTDEQLPTGYGLTTAGYYAVTLTTGQDYNDADFGFGPSLRVDKVLKSLSPAYVGETVTFAISLVNRLPGDGTANGSCVYNVWAGAASTLASPKNFADPSYAIGAPNLNYAIGDFSTGSNKELIGSSYSAGGRTSGISKVEVIANVYFDAYLSDDDLTVTANGTTGPWSTIFNETELNAFAPAEAKKGNLVREIPAANAPGGSWDWNDLAALSLTFAATKDGGADSSKIYVDALGFRVTTDDTSCADASTTINPLPFTDTYDTTYLEFLSADPPPTSHNQSTGTLTWDNLGPLYAGGVRTITVNFKAKAVTASGTTNTGSVSGAKFSSGRSVNNASDTSNVTINASGSIGGVIWADTNNSGWSGSAPTGTGYNSGDTFIPGTQVELYMCVDSTTQLPIPLSAASGSATCSSVGGYWKLVQSTYTNNTGAYLFSGLRDGFYNVKVVESSLPPGFNQTTSRRAEPDADATAGRGDGITCGACDGAWYAGTEKLTDIDSINNGSTGDTASSKVSFGYQDDNDNQGAVIGYVWHDLDGDGVWDAGEQPISGVSVYLCTTTPCNASTPGAILATTNDIGRYAYGNLTPGSYYVGVTTPSGMSQSGDPDSTLDNQTTSSFSVVANGVSGPYNFGYTGGLSIGDLVYADWNGDGDPDTGEEGIGGVKVRLYRDVDGDGLIDPEDTLLDTRDTLYNIIAGGLDINNDGVIDGDDDKTLFNGYRIINGGIDLNGDGFVTNADDGTFMGYTVIDGLIDVNGGGVDGTDNASLLGFYEFTNLPGNGTKYLVMVDTSTLPAGYNTQTADPDSTKDSKTVVTLNSDDVDTADFGYQPRGFSSIGDLVWNDANGNGAQDAGESGINDVRVNLYQDQDGDGVIDAEDALVAYTFTGIDVINGYLDVNGDGNITGADDSPALLGIRVIDGKLDINNDGVVNTLDDGAFAGYTVIDGLLDMNSSGGVTGDDDGTLNGLYQFRDLPAGNYIVEIPSSNFNSGQPLYSQTQSYDPDSATVRDNKDQVALGANENYVLGDFGYTSSSIGDLVWRDDDGDGLWDTNEPGINGVVMELYLDANNDGTPDGAAMATTTTANNSLGQAGYYVFGGLAPNNYIVKVADSNFQPGGALYDSTTGTRYKQTYDPDAYTEPCSGGQCNDESWINGYTTPPPNNTFFPGLQLGQNDMSNDFGYQPPAIIGDFVWQDLDGDGVQDPGEPGIPNVDVFLCASSSPCTTSSADYIATATTNSEGYYYFAGRAAGTYVVTVDTTDLPAGMTQTGDPEYPGVTCSGGQCDNSGNVNTTGNVSDLSNDFGYRGSAVVSGYIFFDAGTPGDPYQSGTDTPLPGVPVYLYDNTGKLVGSMLTDSNGFYEFHVATGTYTIRVGQSLSARANGMVLNYEPDEQDDGNGGGNDDSDLYCGSGTFNRTSTPGCDTATTVHTSDTDALIQDFGFYANMDCGDLPNTYNSLPTNYNIKIVNEGPCHISPFLTSNPTHYLGAQWDGETDGQPDATAGRGGGGDDSTAPGPDDEDGVTPITPLGSWVANSTVQIQAVVVGSNAYLAAWFDWDDDGSFFNLSTGQYDTGEYQYFGLLAPGSRTLNVNIPSTFVRGGTTRYLNMRFRLYKGSSPPPVIAPTGNVTEGEVEDYQWEFPPTVVTLPSFTAAPAEGAVLLEWETASELDSVGFNLYRAESPDGPQAKLNASLIPAQAPGSVLGARYAYRDETAAPGVTYYYWLEDVDTRGIATLHGPASAAWISRAFTGFRAFLPFVSR